VNKEGAKYVRSIDKLEENKPLVRRKWENYVKVSYIRSESVDCIHPTLLLVLLLLALNSNKRSVCIISNDAMRGEEV
jgi:hypothetical protein